MDTPIPDSRFQLLALRCESRHSSCVNEVSAALRCRQVEMIAAQMAQQIVRAAHEVTEEREVITEVTTEQIEVIKKPEEVGTD